MWKIRDQYIIDDTDGQVICCWGSYTTKRKAQLIAAAPELLAALQEIANVASSTRRLEVNMAWIENAARTAIVKAAGK